MIKHAIGAESLRKIAGLILVLNPKVEWRIEIKRHIPRRTLSQNKLLWAIYTEIARETGNDKEAIHLAMKKKFLPPQFVQLGHEEIVVPSSSAIQDKQAFSEFVDRVAAFAASELGISV